MLRTNIERRILAAIEFYDVVTDAPVRELLRLEAGAGVSFVRNRSGYYVLLSAPGWEDYSTCFLTPPDIAPRTLVLKVSDPHDRYLSRAFQVTLPRSLDTAQENAVYKPVRVPVFPAPAAHTPSNWAKLYATIKEEGTGHLLPWALLIVEWKGVKNTAMSSSGLADQRGEVVIPLPGILLQVTSDDQDHLTELETPLAATIYWDTSVTKLTSLDALKIEPVPNADYVPDLEARLDPTALDAPAKVIKSTNYQPELKIKARQTLAVTLHVKLS